MTTTKFGYLALLGCPNAGKSTLMNSCLGLKLAGVSSKPQTTRNRIVGVISDSETQIGVLDTPGIQKKLPKNGQMMAKYMNKEAWAAARDADLVCYLIDSHEGPVEADWAHLSGLADMGTKNLVIILSQVDRINKEKRENRELQIRELLEEKVPKLCGENKVRILQISAKIADSVSDFLAFVSRHMPEGPHHYPSETLTDRPKSFVVGELIREQLFRQLGQEIPYSTAVTVENIDESKKLRHIMATIYVPKKAHKGMVIGKGGSKLKEIGSEARPPIEKFLGTKVFLELFVKVQEGWHDRPAMISELLGPSYEE